MSALATTMLRKLRVKFIVLNMALAALVLGVSFAAICIADYQSTMDEVRETLVQAISPGGKGPHPTLDRDPLAQKEELGLRDGTSDGGADDGENGGSASALGRENGGTQKEWAPPSIGGKGDSTLPVAVYYVTGSELMQLFDRSSATVPEDLLLEAVPAALASESEWGYLPEQNLYFAKHGSGYNDLVAFADGDVANSWQSLAITLAITGAGALLVLLGLNLLFSRWALRPVQRAWNQQQQFIADASHELKTPLTVILANNAILRERGDETIASQAQWLESTQVEAERMQGLVTDMLDLARSDAQESAGEKAPVDFSRLVEGEVLTFESVAFERGISWESTVEEAVSVAGDGRRLERLVAVLLDNACKYTDPGGCVNVALAAEEKFARLTVRNSGDPIPPEDVAHLFDRFYRADKARTHNATGGDGSETPAGYGLGLAIAQEIAQSHKGTLSVTSTSEEGTIFTLRLPLA